MELPDKFKKKEVAREVSPYPLREAIDSGDYLTCKDTADLVDIYIDGQLCILLHEGSVRQRPLILLRNLCTKLKRLREGSTAHHTAMSLIGWSKQNSQESMLRMFETWYIAFFGVVPYPNTRPKKYQLRQANKLIKERQ